jgi:C1A family cysteine protease
MRMPKNSENILGGHAVTAIGYDDNRQAFIIRNSWGNSWGAGGNFYMPYNYIINSQYCSDFWTVTKVE